MPSIGETVKLVDRYTGRVPISFSQFYLGEPVRISTPHWSITNSGLLTVRPGAIKFIIETRSTFANVIVEVYDSSPADRIHEYEDVVEDSYACESGKLSLLSWSKDLVHALDPLPAEQATYRVRYHMRNTHDLTSSSLDLCGSPAESLVQIWPAERMPARDIKVTSSAGRFWQPLSKLADSLLPDTGL